MFEKLFHKKIYNKETEETDNREAPMEKDIIYAELYKIAPNFVSKLEYHHSSLPIANGLRFMFANEKGGTGDFEEKYGKNIGHENNAEIFYKMAKHFENLTIEPYYEHPKRHGEHLALKETAQYYSQLDYRWLSASDLFCYFSWRTAIRKVLSEKIEDLPEDNKEILFLQKVSDDIYLQLYLQEIINLIGIKDPGEGYEIISEQLRQIFGNIDYVHRYIEIEKNFALYYGFDDGTKYTNKIDNVITKLEKGEITELINYCQKNSSYDYLQSSFYSTEHGYLIFEVLPYVLSGIKKYMLEKNIDISILLAGKLIEREWEPFSGYNFLEKNVANPICYFNPEYEETYSFESGEWIEHLWWHHSTYTSAIIGYIIKLTEKILREVFKYNSRITVNIDRLRKNPNYRGEADEETMYIAFRETIYTYECQNYIQKIVRTYIKEKENHQF